VSKKVTFLLTLDVGSSWVIGRIPVGVVSTLVGRVGTADFTLIKMAALTGGSGTEGVVRGYEAVSFSDVGPVNGT